MDRGGKGDAGHVTNQSHTGSERTRLFNKRYTQNDRGRSENDQKVSEYEELLP